VAPGNEGMSVPIFTGAQAVPLADTHWNQNGEEDEWHQALLLSYCRKAKKGQSHTVVPRLQDPKRLLRSPKSHAKTKSLYSGLSSGSPTSPTQQICTESPEPHPGKVFIGEGQEAELLILGVNRLDVIQVRGSWHIGIGFYSILSWSSGVWTELFFFFFWSPWAKACFAQL
jgi:hypothetical protein